jgi:hypothetical protein
MKVESFYLTVNLSDTVVANTAYFCIENCIATASLTSYRCDTTNGSFNCVDAGLIKDEFGNC